MNEPPQIISTIAYNTIERTIDWHEQVTQQTVHQIFLYADTISTTKHNFQLEHVHDISYKPFSSGTGLFYLHTIQGVFTYQIDSDPESFIHAYKKLRG